MLCCCAMQMKAKASEASLGRGDSPCSSFAFACSLLVLLFILLLLLFLLFLLLLLLCFLLQNLIRRRHPIKRQIPTQKRTTSVCSLREKSLSIESQVYSDVSWRKGVWTKHACDADATWRRCHLVSMCVLSYATPTPDTQPHSAHPTDVDIMHKVHFKILCLHATKLEFSCFDGIIMCHTTSGCTYKRDVSRRPCFASRQPSTRKVRTPLLACLSKVALSHHAITIACRANWRRLCWAIAPSGTVDNLPPPEKPGEVTTVVYYNIASVFNPQFWWNFKLGVAKSGFFWTELSVAKSGFLWK